MINAHLSPPHLTIAVYSDQPGVETFGHIHDAATSLGCIPQNVVVTAPMDRDFELVSDLGGAADIRELDTARYQTIVAGQVPGERPIKAVCSHRRFGKMVVEYQMKRGPGRHPIGVSTSAGALGIPDFLWSRQEKRSAYAIADFMCKLLAASVARCDALYAGVGVEFSLPTPQQLSDRDAQLPTELFVSHRLLGQDGVREQKLRKAYSGGDVSDWGDGIFLSGWAPFNSRRRSVEESTPVDVISAKILSSAFR